jgi:hypothetical protein
LRLRLRDKIRKVRINLTFLLSHPLLYQSANFLKSMTFTRGF